MRITGKLTVTAMILAALSILTAGIFFMLDKSSVATGLYSNLTSDLQFAYQTPLTPISWINNQWNAVIIWLAFFLIYGLSTTFRRIHDTTDLMKDGERASYLYKHPCRGVVPYGVYSSIAVVCALSVVYLFLWDMLYFRASAALTLLSAVLAHIAYFHMACQTFHVQTVLFHCAKALDVWLLRILGLNGLALLSAWLTYLALLNLSVAMVYAGGSLSPHSAGEVCGGIYLGWIVVTLLADLFFIEKYTRYALVHYISSMISGCGLVLFRPHVYGDFPLSTQLGIAILGVAGTAFVVKLAFAVVRHFSHPLPTPNKQFLDMF